MARFLRFAYLLRFPLLSLVALAVLLPLLYQVALFQGFADLRVLGVGSVSLLSFLTAAAIIVNANLIFLYGEYRLTHTPPPGSVVEAFLDNFKHPGPAALKLLESKGLNPPHGLAVCLVGFGGWISFMTVTLHNYPGEATFGNWWVGALAGLALGITVVLIVTWLQIHETRPLTVAGKTNPKAGPFLVFPLQYIGPIHSFLYRTAFTKTPWTLRLNLGSRLARILPGTGYSAGTPPNLLPGNVFALMLWGFTLIFHYVGYYLGADGRTTWNAENSDWVSTLVPTLAYVVALILLFCWSASAVGFFFDGFPFPSGVAMLVLILGFAYVWPNDFTFPVDAATAGLDQLKSQNESYLQPIRSNSRVIVVAAAGGGIQAAGWTAEVLDQLTALSEQFRRHVVALSSVSGGSVGVYTYVAGSARLRQSGRDVGGSGLDLSTAGLDTDPCDAYMDRAANLGSVTCSAMDSSLESTAWGLVHPDLTRTIFGIPLPPDRGTALERSIAVHAARAAGWKGVGPDAKTSAILTSDILQPTTGQFPILLINSTSVDSGMPVVFTNSSFEGQKGIKDFHSEVQGKDVKLPTAVRLSASFPYVSPAARADAQSDQPVSWHLVDGGYYDNFGVATALRWIEAAHFNPSTAVLLLRIEAFPQDPEPKGEVVHWPYQLIAPLFTLYTARGSAQQTRANREIGLFEQIQAQDANFYAITFRFEPAKEETDPEKKNESPPLSWHLAAEDKNKILHAWEKMQEAGCSAYVKDFVEGRTPTDSGRCELVKP